MHIALSVPAGNERGPQYMDQMLAALHQANPDSLPVTLELRRQDGEVTLACRFPEELRAVLEGQLYAQYPECRIDTIAETGHSAETKTWTLDLHLHHELFPIRRYVQFEDALNRVSADPLTALLSTLARTRNGPPSIRALRLSSARRLPAFVGERRAFWSGLHRLSSVITTTLPIGTRRGPWRRDGRCDHLHGSWGDSGTVQSIRQPVLPPHPAGNTIARRICKPPRTSLDGCYSLPMST